MTDIYPKDFSSTAASNGTVGGINVAEGMTAAQLNDAIRAVLAVFALPDFGTLPFKTDTIAESTAAAGVTIDGLLIKDGDIPSVPASITTAIQAAVPVGTMLETFKATPDTGYRSMNGDTLGSAASAATQASDDNENLFTFLWTNVSNTYAAVSGGRGASAAADWAANKTIVIPNRADRFPVGAGGDYEAGETGGAASVKMTAGMLIAHTHTINAANADGDGSRLERSPSTSSSTLTTGSTGSADPDPIPTLPPYMATYWQIKY